MKHLEQFEGYTHQDNNIILTEDDINKINDLLLDKMKEDDIEPNIDTIYSELELVKKDPKNSFIYHIIKNYFNLEHHGHTIHTSLNFFRDKYGQEIKKFRDSKSKEYKVRNKRQNGFVMLPFEGEMIKVPRGIGHGYTPIKILPLEELKTKFSRHKRLKVFHHKGLGCVSCPKVGEYLIAARDSGGGMHVDLYTKDFELMTVDHIKPKSIGGSYDLENLDPMCQVCNTKKADKYEDLEG